MVRVACLQLNSTNDMPRNLEQTVSLMRRAHAAGAEFILTPECTGVMAANRQELLSLVTLEQDCTTLTTLSALAGELGCWLLIGSLAIKDSCKEKISNRSFLINPGGEIVSRYDKIHMYDVNLPEGPRYQESESYCSGNQLVGHALPWGKLGLTICYDVRFPHLFRALAKAGADFIAVPAAFVRYTGQAHWEVLLRARAIENGCYILAPAQTGDHPGGRQTFGHALIIDPWGEVIADAGLDVGFCIADISSDRVRDIRHRLPSLTHDRDYNPCG